MRGGIRKQIHDAYALHMTSKGFEVKHTAAIKAIDVEAELAKRQLALVHAEEPGRTDKYRERMAARVEQYAPVAHIRGDHSVKFDSDRAIFEGVEAGKIIAQVEALPPHLKAWCYWAYTPFGKTNQQWLKEAETLAEVRNLREQADSMTDYAASIPARIERCKTEERRQELQQIDTDALLAEAARMQFIAARLERVVNGPDPSAAWWNWLDEQIAERAPKKMRKQTLLRVKRVCVATCYNYRLKVQPGGAVHPELLGPKGICERFGVPCDNFERDYRQWLKWTYDICDDIEGCLIVRLLRQGELKKCP